MLFSRPAWAIRACKAQAGSIISSGRSQLYHHAATWLEKVRAASSAAGRETDWRGYVEELIALHRRKYSLVPLLDRLR